MTLVSRFSILAAGLCLAGSLTGCATYQTAAMWVGPGSAERYATCNGWAEEQRAIARATAGRGPTPYVVSTSGSGSTTTVTVTENSGGEDAGLAADYWLINRAVIKCMKAQGLKRAPRGTR